MRIAMTALAASLTLAGCATRPQVTNQGDLSMLKGQVVMSQGVYHSSLATPTGPDAVLAQTIEREVEGRLLERGSIGAGVLAPRYLIQVAVATSDPAVGVSPAVGPRAEGPWRSAPTKLRFWNRRGPLRTATLVVVEVATGKPTAWATVRSSSADAKDFADRLLAAVSG